MTLLLLSVGCNEEEKDGERTVSTEARGAPAVDYNQLDVLLAEDFQQLRDSLSGDNINGEMDRISYTLLGLLNRPESFEVPFDSLASVIGIVWSDDRSARVFQWFHPAGGQAWRVDAILQWRDSAGDVAAALLRFEEELDPEAAYLPDQQSPASLDRLPGFWYFRLHRLDTDRYLAEAEWQVDAVIRGLEAFVIEVSGENAPVPTRVGSRESSRNRKSSRPAIFELANGSHDQSITLDFTWFDQTWGPDDVDRHPTFRYDSARKILTFPELRPIPNDSWYSKPTGDTIRLKYEGRTMQMVESSSGVP